VHIGSLSRWKGVERLAQYYRAALEAFPDFRVLIIGPAVDTEARRAMDTLHASFPGRVELRTRCSRPEALELLHTSLCVLSPATHYGWGLIGDAWSSGTPVVSVKEHYDLLHEKNCLVASSAEDFVQCIRSLREEEDLRTNITAGGYVTAREHSPARVSEHLHAALERFGRT
jgi:glycosyltransferase involved in cell wall biosynthesis